MPWSLTEAYLLLPAFALVLCRVAGLMLATPLFSTPALPLQIKAFLAVAVSMAVFPTVSEGLTVPVTLASAVPGLLGEFAIGLFIGFGATLMFSAVQVAGQLIGQMSGTALGAVFDPNFETQMTAGTQVLYFLALMIFFAIGGHRELMVALLDSFQTLPLLSFQVSGGLLETLVELMDLSFAWAIRIGAPVVVALMVTLVTLGFIGRTVPQLNILTVGFPLKAGIGVLVMALAIVSIEPVIIESWDVCMEAIRAGLQLAPGAP